MDIDTFRKTFRAWLSKVSGQVESCIVWDGEARPVANTIIVIGTTSDEDLYTYNKNEIGETSTSEYTAKCKNLTLQIKVETIAQTDTLGAIHLIEKIRSATMNSKALLLTDLGVKIANDSTGVRSFNYNASGQVMHVKSFDLFARYVLDETEVRTGDEWFDKIGFSVQTQEITTEEIEVTNG